MKQATLILITFALIFCAGASPTTSAEWPPATDYLLLNTDCALAKDQHGCEYSRETWPEDYRSATNGDYQGQRNVAFCLSTGCDGAIRSNKILGCAWRIVIIASGHLSADDSDTMNLKHYCGPEHVDRTDIAAAEAQARRIIKLIEP